MSLYRGGGGLWLIWENWYDEILKLVVLAKDDLGKLMDIGFNRLLLSIEVIDTELIRDLDLDFTWNFKMTLLHTPSFGSYGNCGGS